MTLQDVIRLQQLGRIGEALSAARRLARKETRNADLFLFLGMLQAQSSEIDKAAESFRRAVQIRPDFLEARYNLAYACNLLNRHADAVEHYRVVLAKAPSNLDALNNLASSLTKSGAEMRPLKPIAHWRVCPRITPCSNIILVSFSSRWVIGRARWNRPAERSKRRLPPPRSF